MGVNNLTFGAELEQEIYKLCCSVNFYFFLFLSSCRPAYFAPISYDGQVCFLKEKYTSTHDG